jgi:hypothetical protein
MRHLQHSAFPSSPVAKEARGLRDIARICHQFPPTIGVRVETKHILSRSTIGPDHPPPSAAFDCFECFPANLNVTTSRLVSFPSRSHLSTVCRSPWVAFTLLLKTTSFKDRPSHAIVLECVVSIYRKPGSFQLSNEFPAPIAIFVPRNIHDAQEIRRDLDAILAQSSDMAVT